VVNSLRCEAVEYAYPGGERVVDGASLSVAAGSLTCVIGPNGAGKSTLLKAMGGLLSVDSGVVTVDGEAVRALESRVRARTLALVPQFLDAIPAVTVESFVLGGRYGHLDGWRRARSADHQAVLVALREAHVFELRERLLAELSGGQRQRVLIARALAQEARYLLVDEPTSSLDPEHQLGVFALLSRLAQEGHGIVVVTHDLNLASQHAAEIALMHSGRFVAVGTPKDVLKPEVLDPVYGAHFRFGKWDDEEGAERPFVLPWSS
jgi:ABC-type cobalamin/Fe3+-siderophores transport system ATPase subunit